MPLLIDKNQIASTWPLLLYFGFVVVVTAAMLGVSYVLGERHHERQTAIPYESGVASFGSARLRLSTKYYLIALFFVIFDIEAVFIFAWAIALEDAGWTGFTEMCIFIAVLLSALVYLWRRGALDWSKNAA